MNKIITFLLFLLINTSLIANQAITYPEALQGPVEQLLAFPKARETLSVVNQRVGKIKVKLAPFSFSTGNAMWHVASRSIVLNSERPRSEGETIRSILFEMHNAKNQHKFKKLDRLACRKAISRQNYIRAIEYVEYENVLETIALLDEAIEEGYYPESASWSVHKDFESHFAWQHEVGHSQFIGKMYDMLSGSKHIA